MPIVDYRCHMRQKEIFKDLHFENITGIRPGGGHYKRRIMRPNGADEYYRYFNL